MKWLRENWTLVALVVVGMVLGRSLFPRTKSTERIIPQIITKYDTVRTRWTDTVKVHHYTTDTFNLVISQTIHDTVVIDNNANSKLWPIISYTQLSSDTGTVRTFELVSGRGSFSKIYTPGPLTGLLSDSLPTPKMSFGNWPSTEPTFWVKAKYTLLGAGFALALKGLLK